MIRFAKNVKFVFEIFMFYFLHDCVRGEEGEQV